MPKLNSARHILIIILVCAAYTLSFSKIHLENSAEYMEFNKLVRGWADTPFQYRYLVPWMAGASLPYLKQLHLAKNLADVKFLFEHLFVFLLLCSFFFSAPYLIFGNRKDDGRGVIIKWAATWVLMLALPFHFIIPASTYYYPSDIPAILFFILGLTFLRLEKWFFYLIVFMVGTFNRETIIFLSFAFLLTNWKSLPRIKFVGLFVFQIMAWLAIKYLLWRMFQSNTIDSFWYADFFGIFRNSWGRNMQILGESGSYTFLITVYGYLWIPLIFLWKDIRDKWLKSVLLIVPLFHLAMLIPGEINEMRIYGEMLPLVILGVIGGIFTNQYFIKQIEEPS